MRYIKKYWIVFIVVIGLLIFIKPLLCFLMLGILTMFIGMETLFHLKRLQTKGIECTGKIVEYRTDSDGDKIPIVEFQTTKGESIKETPLVYSFLNLAEVFNFSKMINKPVSVLYDADDPKIFVFLNEGGNNNFSAFIFILLGFGFVVISISGLFGYIQFG